ncbi:MAG: arylsulfotransferase family protein [Halofilum sp. (in: g-proteobacteria)]
MNLDRIAQALFIAATAFLIFIAGALTTMGEIFPYSYLNEAYRAGIAVYRQQTEYATPLQTDLWHPARTDARGVTQHDAARSAPGYTLYTSGDGPYARMIDAQGKVIHEWRRPFSDVSDERSPMSTPRDDEFIYMRKAHVLPNGDLLAIYIASGDTPWGYGMAKLNRESELLWFYPGRTHHDFDVASDGRIYALTHDFVPAGPHRQFEDPYLDDYLVVLGPEGDEQRRISLTHALATSRFRMLLGTIPHFATGDPLHTNAVQRLDNAQAEAIPGAESGDVLLSFRELSLIAVLSVEDEQIVWATRGPWVEQHDPRVLDNGNILIFDNGGAFQPGNASRVLEFNPRTHAVTWRYAGTPEQPFDSHIRGAAERLRNGNTLITESNGGRLLEVTAAGEIVWEYVHPVRGGDAEQYIPAVSWGQRIAPTQLADAFRSSLARR